MKISRTSVFIFVCALTASAAGRVLPGVDNLLQNHRECIADKRIAIVTNQTGYTADGRRTIDAIKSIAHVTVVEIFTPEHGLDGTVNAGSSVASSIDSASRVPVISLYGALRKPKKEMLAGIDAIVYDVQDIGIRSYTFISTLGLVMQAAAEANVKIIVLDRPGMLADRVDGNLLDTAYRSFVGKYPIPYVYGLTTGELARMINDEGMLGAHCNLTVVPMNNWSRAMPWDSTGLRWRPTSPNIPEPATVIYCAAFGAIGELGAGYQGIGSRDAFRVFGGVKFPARGVDSAFRALHLRGVHTLPVDTIIKTKTGTTLPISFIRFKLDRDSVDDLFAVGLQLLALLHRMNLLKPPDSAHIAMFNKICGASMFAKIMAGENVNAIIGKGNPPSPALLMYMKLRKKYLFY